MQMKNNLAGLGPVVEYDPKAILNAILLCDLSTDAEELSGQLLFHFCNVNRPRDVFFGNDKEMNRGLG